MPDVNLYLYVEKKLDPRNRLNFIINGERYRVRLGLELVQWKNIVHKKWIECGWFPFLEIGNLASQEDYPLKIVGWAINSIDGLAQYEFWCFNEDLDPDSDSSIEKFIEAHGKIDEFDDYWTVCMAF